MKDCLARIRCGFWEGLARDRGLDARATRSVRGLLGGAWMRDRGGCVALPRGIAEGRWSCTRVKEAFDGS